MKVELEESDKNTIIKAVIKSLTNNDRPSFRIGGRRSKIEEIVEKEVATHIREIMVEVVSDPEFKDRIYEIGLERARDYLSNMKIREVLE